VLTANEIAAMRHTSVTALPDTCTITRTGGEPTLDPGSLDLDYPTADVIYTGPCRVRTRDAQELNVQVGDLHETLGPYVATLPALAAADGVTAGDPVNVRVDDYLVVTVSVDAAIVSRAFQVRHISWGSWQIDRRLGLEDREQPQGVEVPS